jgi:hypothetical protein
MHAIHKRKMVRSNPSWAAFLCLCGLMVCAASTMAFETAPALDDAMLLGTAPDVGTTADGAAGAAGTPVPAADVGGAADFVCVPGHKRRAGETPCIDCPVGFVSRVYDADACEPCRDGETTLTVGASECVPLRVQAA